MLRIFSDKSFLPAGKPHFVIFFPFWGRISEDPNDPSSGRYERYAERGAEVFEFTSLESADIAILPASWENYNQPDEQNLAKQFVDLVHRAGKKCAVFFWRDSTEPVPLENVITFRTSLYASDKSSREFAMPAWSEDFLQKYLNGRVRFREKEELAMIGFCGAAPHPNVKSFKQKIKAWISLSDEEGRFIRKKAIDLLQEAENVRTNFIIRDNFLGGALLPDGRLDYKRARESRLEFVDNIVNSDYVLCVRGAGNYSYRLYETLSCGRVPVFVNTDCVLPYETEIDWRKYCVWVEQKNLSRISDRIIEFHNRLTNDEFKNLQGQCRKIWEEYLSPEGFFANFYRYFL